MSTVSLGMGMCAMAEKVGNILTVPMAHLAHMMHLFIGKVLGQRLGVGEQASKGPDDEHDSDGAEDGKEGDGCVRDGSLLSIGWVARRSTTARGASGSHMASE